MLPSSAMHGVYDPDTLKAMGAAFDTAVQSIPHTYKIMRGRGGDSRCSSFDTWNQASLMPILELWPCSIS
jgi:hypothetical protein